MGKNETIKSLEDALGEANERAHRLARDNDAYRARERNRMRYEHDEKQRKLKQAERAERLKRVENIQAGLLPLDGATQWAIVHEEGAKPGIEVFVPLSEVEEREVQAYLNGRNERKVNVNVRVFDEVRVTDAINKMAANAQRIRDCYSF